MDWTEKLMHAVTQIRVHWGEVCLQRCLLWVVLMPIKVLVFLLLLETSQMGFQAALLLLRCVLNVVWLEVKRFLFTTELENVKDSEQEQKRF